MIKIEISNANMMCLNYFWKFNKLFKGLTRGNVGQCLKYLVLYQYFSLPTGLLKDALISCTEEGQPKIGIYDFVFKLDEMTFQIKGI